MKEIAREHLLQLKQEKGKDNKLEIQKVQQAIDNDSYGYEEYQNTKEKLTTEDFKSRFVKPPELERECMSVYTFIGGLYIQLLDSGYYYWEGYQDKDLSQLIKFMCNKIYKK